MSGSGACGMRCDGVWFGEIRRAVEVGAVVRHTANSNETKMSSSKMIIAHMYVCVDDKIRMAWWCCSPNNIIRTYVYIHPVLKTTHIHWITVKGLQPEKSAWPASPSPSEQKRSLNPTRWSI